MIEAAAKGTIEGVFEEIGAKKGLFSQLLFPAKRDLYDAVEYYKTQVRNDESLNLEEKAIKIASATKHITECKRQLDIVEKAEKILSESKEDSCVLENNIIENQEWFERFLDASRFVTEEEMRLIWANVLAQKTIKPSNVPKSITRILMEMTKAQAEALQTIANMKVYLFSVDDAGNIKKAGYCLVVPKINHNLGEYGINTSTLNELEALGVLKVDHYVFDEVGTIGILYNHKMIKPYNFSDEGHIHTGCVFLTQAGECLANIAEKRILDGYLEKVKAYMEGAMIYSFDNKMEIGDCDEFLENQILTCAEKKCDDNSLQGVD